ncbi:MAG: DUF2894 domain-containing protein [Haliea sp.]|uniref:DUF2894 domain-containing protein n=1 Tax=Haliea sp. TaxID=1932666 RepID=UPI0032EF7680
MTAAVSALAALRAEYARLLAAGAARTDPLRSQLAGTLLARCETQRPGVVRHLRARAAHQLEAMAAGLERGATRADTERAASPAAAALPAREALAGLRQLLREREAQQPLSPRQQFEAELRAQERAIFGSASAVETEGDSPAQGGGDLLAAIRFLDLQAGQAADRELVALRAALPEDPGPLNPQALVIRSLATLQKISPAYVERFLHYSRSLCWLDSAANSRR